MSNIVFSMLFTEDKVVPEKSDTYFKVSTDTGSVLAPVLVIPGENIEELLSILQENVDSFSKNIRQEYIKKYSEISN